MGRRKKPRSERLTTPTSLDTLATQAKKKQKVAEQTPDENVLTPEEVVNFYNQMIALGPTYVTDPAEKALYRGWLSQFNRKLANTTDPEIRKMVCEYTKKVEEVLDHQRIAIQHIRTKVHRMRVDAFPDEVGAEQNGELQPIEVSDVEEKDEDEEDDLTDEMPEDEEEE